MLTKERESRRSGSVTPNIQWAWRKQDDKYIVYSPDHKFVGVALTLRDAKSLFADRVNEYLESLGAKYRLRM